MKEKQIQELLLEPKGELMPRALRRPGLGMAESGIRGVRGMREVRAEPGRRLGSREKRAEGFQVLQR